MHSRIDELERTGSAAQASVDAGASLIDDQRTSDERFMRAALRLSRRGLGQTWPNPSVGALVIDTTKPGTPRVLGAGVTADAGRPHAEQIALENARHSVRGSTVYVTLEPCCHYGRTPPCTDALIQAGVARVVTAMADPDHRVSGLGHTLLAQAGVEVETRVLERDARAIHVGHVQRVRTGRPFVTLKVAVTADGYIAARGRKPIAISSPQAMARVHMLRAEYDAILVGSGTALADDPQLTVRLPGMEARSPTRVILDTHLKLPLDSKVVKGARDAPVWVVTASRDEAAINTLLSCGVEVIRLERDADGRIDLQSTLVELGSRGVTRLFVEGGAILTDAMLTQGLADQVIIARSRQNTLETPGIAPTCLGALQSNGLDGGYQLSWQTDWGGDEALVFRTHNAEFSDLQQLL